MQLFSGDNRLEKFSISSILAIQVFLDKFISDWLISWLHA